MPRTFNTSGPHEVRPPDQDEAFTAKAVGSEAPGGVRIYSDRSVLSDVIRFAAKHAPDFAGGLLLGHRCLWDGRKFVKVIAWFAEPPSEGTRGFTVNGGLLERATVWARENGLSTVPVGWFLSMPTYGLSMSGSSVGLHDAWFPDPLDVHLALDPGADGLAFFCRESGTIRDTGFVLYHPRTPAVAEPPQVATPPSPPDTGDDPLQADELFAAVCEEVFRDGVVDAAENRILGKLSRLLELPREDMDRLFHEAREKHRSGLLAAGDALDPAQLYRRLVERAWIDGVLESEERTLLVEMARVLELDPAEAAAMVEAGAPASGEGDLDLSAYDGAVLEHALAGYARQLMLDEVLGGRAWNVDLVAATLKVEEVGSLPIQVLGSWAREDNTFLWAWANPGNADWTASLSDARDLRRLGESPGWAVMRESLVSAQWVHPHELGPVCGELCGGKPLYLGDYGHGALLLLVDESHPLESFPLVSLPRLVLDYQARTAMPMAAAVQRFLERLGLTVTRTGSEILAERPHARIAIILDDQGRVSEFKISGDSRGGLAGPAT